MSIIDLVEILCSDETYYWRPKDEVTFFLTPSPKDFGIRISKRVLIYTTNRNVYTKNTSLSGKIVIFKDQFYIVELESSFYYSGDFLIVLHSL